MTHIKMSNRLGSLTKNNLVNGHHEERYDVSFRFMTPNECASSYI